MKKALVTRPNDPSLNARTHVVEGNNQASTGCPPETGVTFRSSLPPATNGSTIPSTLLLSTDRNYNLLLFGKAIQNLTFDNS